MGKMNAALAARAWGLLRQTLLWARKGGAYRRSLLSGGNRSNFLKGHSGGGGSSGIHDGYQIRCGEKELSFGETPLFRHGSMRSARRRVKSMRVILSILACINPPHPTDQGFKDDEQYARSRREAFFGRSKCEIDGDAEGEKEFASSEWLVGDQEVEEEEDFASAEWVEGPPEAAEEEETGVDARAEEFIARFYQLMKLQRQVSLLQYHEMLHRGT